MYDELFQPIRFGKLELKNRMIVPPMLMNYCAEDGSVTERYIRYMEERARGDFSLLMTEQTAVDPLGRGNVNSICIWSDDLLPGLKELTKRVHAAGAKISPLLFHAGRQTSKNVTGSALHYGPTPFRSPWMTDVPKETSNDEIHRITEQFGKAALRAKTAGFDMVTIHAHHGYLLGSFLSPFINKRVDEYGGNLVNRFRFTREVFENVRAKVGADYPIGLRVSAIELLDRDEYLAICQMAEELGTDMIFFCGGESPYATTIHDTQRQEERFIADVTAQAKRVVSIPVGSSGYIQHPRIANADIAAGKMVCMAH